MGRLNWKQGTFQGIKNPWSCYMLFPYKEEKMKKTLLHDYIYLSLVYKPFNNFKPREDER